MDTLTLELIVELIGQHKGQIMKGILLIVTIQMLCVLQRMLLLVLIILEQLVDVVME